MKRLGVLLFLIGFAACGPPVIRTKQEIAEFRQFLENSRTEDGVLVRSRVLPPTPEANIWENSGKYQGDILLDDTQLEKLVADFAAGGAATTDRNAYMVGNPRWPNNVMIYEFGANQFDDAQKRAILDAMSVIERSSCVRFRRRTNERVYVTITGNNNGCYATVGYSSTNPNRILNVARGTPGRGCLSQIVIIHELMHNLGFQHMHQTADRDNYVRINYNNMNQNSRHNFNRFASNEVSLLGLPYEYASCMHYTSHAFSNNGQPTITPIRPAPQGLGSGSRASNLDWLRLRRYYNCPGAWNTRANEISIENIDGVKPVVNLTEPVKVVDDNGP